MPVTSKYAMSSTPKARPAPTEKPGHHWRYVAEGVTALEQSIVAMRREQDAIYDQLMIQRDWLQDPANADDPMYEQRRAIHRDRWAQWDDLNERSEHLLTAQQEQLDLLEGREKELGLMRLLSWSEPPF